MTATKRLLILLAIAALAAPAFAEHDDDDDGYEQGHHGRQMRNTPADPVWRQECGSCHIAYPPGMLPAANWKKLMAGLSDHFGNDASLTPEEQRRVTGYLLRNAGQARVAANTLRITETDGFIRQHREVWREVWKRPAVKSAANCQSCHPAAAAGDFNEHAVRIPR